MRYEPHIRAESRLLRDNVAGVGASLRCKGYRRFKHCSRLGADRGQDRDKQRAEQPDIAEQKL